MILNPSTTLHKYTSGTCRTVAPRRDSRECKSTVGALGGWFRRDNEPQETTAQTCARAGRTACKLSMLTTLAEINATLTAAGLPGLDRDSTDTERAEALADAAQILDTASA